jgi:hypothetical protein
MPIEHEHRREPGELDRGSAVFAAVKAVESVGVDAVLDHGRLHVADRFAERHEVSRGEGGVHGVA